MNQQCKVCGEPAAGFHFGAFTCEGCKSFFGRSYNNVHAVSECKNNNQCVINKKNRTACKSCRLRKCIVVGMSKSGSRYGRRSNWFKIHCLLQEQQQQQQQNAQKSGAPHTSTLGLLPHPPPYSPMFPSPHYSKENNMMMLSLDDYKHPSTSPSVSSPDSHKSDSSVEVGDKRQHMLHHKPSAELPLHKDLFLPLPFPNLASLQGLPAPGSFLPPSAFSAHHLLFPGVYHPALFSHQGLLKPANNNNTYVLNHNTPPPEQPLESDPKIIYLDAVLESQRSPSTRRDMQTEAALLLSSPQTSPSPIQDNPIDLSMKAGSSTSDERRDSPGIDSDGSDDDDDRKDRSSKRSASDDDADEDSDYEQKVKRLKSHRPTPLDLTTKV